MGCKSIISINIDDRLRTCLACSWISSW